MGHSGGHKDVRGRHVQEIVSIENMRMATVADSVGQRRRDMFRHFIMAGA
jgi:ribosomal protein L32E